METKNNTTEAIKIMLEMITSDTYLFLTDVKKTKSVKATLCVDEVCDFTQWVPNSVITDITSEWIERTNGYTILGKNALLIKRWWADKENIGTWREDVWKHEKLITNEKSNISDNKMGYVDKNYKTKFDILKSLHGILKRMNIKELTRFGKIAGCDSKQGFAAYKVALKKIGIGYDDLVKERDNEYMKSVEESIDHEITYYTDYSSSHGKMAVVDSKNNVVATKVCCKSEDILEQSEGEAEAIILAIDQAVKHRKSGWIRLIVYCDAKYLTWANEVFKPGSKDGKKARKVGEYAKQRQVKLEVKWIKGSDNPADKHSRS